MTLERHKSKLIPEIEISGDGNLFVTDSGGTFPLRFKGDKKFLDSYSPPPEDYPNKGLAPSEFAVQSYRSFDPNRDEKRRRYKPKQSKYQTEIDNLGTATWSSKGSKGSSLGRKLRRQKYRQAEDGRYGTYDSMKRRKHEKYGSLGKSSQAGSFRKRGSPPRANSDYQGSFRRRSFDKRKVDLASLKATASRNGFKSNGKATTIPLIDSSLMVFPRTKAEEKLPAIFFLVTGTFLLLLGIGILVASWWHAYFCAIWTGVILICLGVNGLIHKKEYFSKAKNASYIVFGLLSGAAVLVSQHLLLMVLVPIVKTVILSTLKNSTEELSQIVNTTNFSNWHQSIAGGDLDTETMVYISLGLYAGALLFVLVNFFALSATNVAISNHWDAVYVRTGECDHRGKPRFFNPMEQVSLGQVTILFGTLAAILQVSEINLYWCNAWAGFMVIVTGYIASCQARRNDLKSFTALTLFLEIVASTACGGAIVFMTLSLVEDITAITDSTLPLSSTDYGLVLTSASTAALYIFILMVDIIFCVGVLFRLMRQCCVCEIVDRTLPSEA